MKQKRFYYHSRPLVKPLAGVKPQRVTICGSFDEESMSMLFVAAITHKNDSFSKKRGRAICDLRMDYVLKQKEINKNITSRKMSLLKDSDNEPLIIKFEGKENLSQAFVAAAKAWLASNNFNVDSEVEVLKKFKEQEIKRLQDLTEKTITELTVDIAVSEEKALARKFKNFNTV